MQLVKCKTSCSLWHRDQFVMRTKHANKSWLSPTSAVLQTVHKYYGCKCLLCWVHSFCPKRYRPVHSFKSTVFVYFVCAGLAWDKLILLQLYCTYGLRIGQWSKSVIVLLSCCIPQAQVHWFPINHHIGRIVVKAVRGGIRNTLNCQHIWQIWLIFLWTLWTNFIT